MKSVFMLRRIRRGLTESKNQSMEEEDTASPKQYERSSAPPSLFIMSKMRRSLCDVDAEYLFECSSFRHN